MSYRGQSAVDLSPAEQISLGVSLLFTGIARAMAELVEAVAVMPWQEIAVAARHGDDLVIVHDESVSRGVAKVRVQTDGALRMHPLDALHLDYEGDPAAQLQALEAYVVGRAHRQLDEITEELRREMEADHVASI